MFSDLILNGALPWIVLVTIAVVASTALLQWLPSLRLSMESVEAGRVSPIDGLRGFLGLSVFVHHVVIIWQLQFTGQWTMPGSRFATHAGQTAVALFFMITAFLFWKRVLERRDGMNWSGFLIGRLFRLYPAYLVMLVVLASASFCVARAGGYSGPFLRPMLDWLAFTMIQTPDLFGVPETSRIIASVTWSLRYEWLFYIALPLIALLTLRCRQWGAALASAAALAVIYHQLSRIDLSIWTAQPFLGGVVAAHWVRRPGLARLGRGGIASCVALVALGAVITLTPGGFTVPALFGLTLFFVVIASGNDLWSVLRLPGLLWLGDITYSTYLLHGFVLWLMFRVIAADAVHGAPVLYAALAVLADVAVVILSSAVFLLVERPGIELGRVVARHFPRRGW